MEIRNAKQKITVENADLTASEFKNVSLAAATFKDVDLTRSEFVDINFAGARITNVNLSDVEFTDCDLQGTKIEGVAIHELLNTQGQKSKSAPGQPKIVGSAPVLLVSDVVASANYFRDCAGFDYDGFYGEPPSYCICHRDGHYLMLGQVDDASRIVPFWKIRENTCNAYFWVDNADGLYEEMKTKGAKMDYGPCTQPYGVREFGIQDLDGNDLSFGQVIR